MDRIRIVGRKKDSAGRCAICHGEEVGLFTFCEQCGTPAHEECVRELAKGKCPTLGCTGRPAISDEPSPRARRRRNRRERDERASEAADRARRAREASEQPLPATTGGHPRPTASARFGPYARLIVSGLFHATLVLGVVALIILALQDPHATWVAMCKGKRGQGSSEINGLFSLLCSSTFGGAFLVMGVMWLWRLPSVAREVRDLLDRDEPIPMRINVETVGSGKSQQTWVNLAGRDAKRLRFQVNEILTAGWLTRVPPGTVVWVYGYPPPGPYLIELPSGSLALVHPD